MFQLSSSGRAEKTLVCKLHWYVTSVLASDNHGTMLLVVVVVMIWREEPEWQMLIVIRR